MNGDDDYPCEVRGHIAHWGAVNLTTQGTPLTYNAEVCGVYGGFGWCVHPSASPPTSTPVVK